MDPKSEINTRLKRCQEQLAKINRISDRISTLRLWVFVSFIATLVVGWSRFSLAWAVVPVVVFVAVLIIHEQVIRRLQRMQRSVNFFSSSINRMNHQWMGKGRTGSAFFEPEHIYALDLDIYGRGSLFELLSNARTSEGERTLAAWLSAPADRQAINERQKAVSELGPKIELREDIYCLGDEVSSDVHPDVIRDWANQAAVDSTVKLGQVRVVAALMSSLTIFLFACSYFYSLPGFVGFISLMVTYAYRAANKDRVARLIGGVEEARRELSLLALVFRRYEQETFSSAKLASLSKQLEADGIKASDAIYRLERLVTWLDAYRNQFFAPFSILLVWDLQVGISIEKWRQKIGKPISLWLEALGEMEALCAFSQFHFENPEFPFPVISPESVFVADDLAHPLMDPNECVSNSIEIGRTAKLCVVSGSNMSGKSTFLRTIGTNAVLAFAGAPVAAKQLTLGHFQVGASLRVSDDLLTGTSRFFAEIKRLGQIAEISRGKQPLLFLIDEIFNGTNSKDRRIGASSLMKELVSEGAIGLITTHDLEITKIAGELKEVVRNVHFEDQFVDGKLSFDYRLKLGVVERSNALELMRSVGLIKS